MTSGIYERTKKEKIRISKLGLGRSPSMETRRKLSLANIGKRKRYNRIVCGNKYCKLYLLDRGGKEIDYTIFDKEDRKRIEQYQWRKDGAGYCGNLTMRLHQLLLGKKEGYVTDHINRNRLDNRKSNLRLVTHTQNMWNMRCKGVHRHTTTQAWVAQIKVNGKHLHIGCYRTKKEALAAREKVKIELRKF